ncbi:hypothetical protein PFICI_11729 [Pestalotiopsis fici W106-1]|uniref:Fungal N-terminal domain-containing protein n=1 Tax=Pestalotiopsis fici (strain W106-1 / CGMCC3.15140) TaxID=1229662 RepID=W3WT76_PESFW|nr:uncharacterized protein PFICI_11729 [Pestalotiopsis fici W106-1]ETS76342.1 hypothetical protein PFICI_11729 [Pestalotiopsis fici W106-1]
MAEAFAVLASVIGVLDVACRTSAGLIDAVRTWRKCPSLLLALSNEVTDLKVILDHLAKVYQDPDARLKLSNDELSTAIQGHIEIIARHLRKLDVLIRDLKLLTCQRQKLRLLYKTRQVGELEGHLRDGRLKINHLLLIHNVIMTGRVDVELNSVKTDLTQLHAQHRSASTHFEDRLNMIHEQVMLTTELVQSSQTGATGLMPEMDSTLPSQHFPEAANHRGEDTPQLLLGSTRQGHVKCNEEDKANCSDSTRITLQRTTTADQDTEAAQSVVLEAESSGFPLKSMLDEQSSARTYAFSVYSQSPGCQRGCPCSCHSQKPADIKFSMPPLLGKICGDLFCRYIGYPTTSPKCSHRSCLRQGQMHLRMIYLFPGWFIRRSLELLIKRSFGGITFSLKTYRELQWESGSIYQCARDGNVPLLEQRLREDPTCVNARIVGRGGTPLQIALAHAVSDRHVNLVEVLLRNGADPYMAGTGNIPVIAKATEFILSNRIPRHISRRITELMPISAYIDDIGLSFLTKVVLGLCPIDLKLVLEGADRSVLQQLESRDEYSRTPLHWAAALQDGLSVRELLKAGAAVNSPADFIQTSVLHLAVRKRLSEDTHLIDCLLEAGADVKMKNDNGQSAFGYACYHTDVATARKLWKAGGDLNGIDSPLTTAADNNRFDIMKFLLEEGADIEQVHLASNQTALLCAVEENAHECIELLFKYKANYTHMNFQQETILHLAAQGADLETINILAKQDLRGLDPAVRNASGKTALEIQELYGPRDPTIAQAFQNLVHSIERKRSTNQGLLDEDLFYDALEE